MELKDILALRLKSLMDERPDLDTQTKVHKKTELSQSTIQRILAREVHTGLDILQILADGFGVNPLDLLRPLKANEEEAAIAPNYEEKKLLLTWRKLSNEDKHKAMAFISVSAEVKKRHDVSKRKITTDATEPAPINQSAANKRGASRQSVTITETVTHHGEEGRAKRKGRAS